MNIKIIFILQTKFLFFDFKNYFLKHLAKHSYLKKSKFEKLSFVLYFKNNFEKHCQMGPK